MKQPKHPKPQTKQQKGAKTSKTVKKTAREAPMQMMKIADWTNTQEDSSWGTTADASDLDSYTSLQVSIAHPRMNSVLANLKHEHEQPPIHQPKHAKKKRIDLLRRRLLFGLRNQQIRV